jgi:hypothetical protein
MQSSKNTKDMFVIVFTAALMTAMLPQIITLTQLEMDAIIYLLTLEAIAEFMVDSSSSRKNTMVPTLFVNLMKSLGTTGHFKTFASLHLSRTLSTTNHRVKLKLPMVACSGDITTCLLEWLIAMASSYFFETMTTWAEAKTRNGDSA